MRSILLLIILLSLISMSSCKKDDSAEREKFIKTCRAQIPSFLNQKAAEDYCDCNAKALFSKYSVDEVKMMDSVIQSGSPKADSFAKIFQELIGPCRADFMKKANNVNPELPTRQAGDSSIPSLQK